MNGIDDDSQIVINLIEVNFENDSISKYFAIFQKQVAINVYLLNELRINKRRSLHDFNIVFGFCLVFLACVKKISKKQTNEK